MTQKKTEKHGPQRWRCSVFVGGTIQKKGNYIYIYDTGIGFMVMMIFTYTLTIQQKFKNMWVNRYHSPYTWILWGVIWYDIYIYMSIFYYIFPWKAPSKESQHKDDIRTGHIKRCSCIAWKQDCQCILQVILLMVSEIRRSPAEVGSLPYYLHGFFTSRGC